MKELKSLFAAVVGLLAGAVGGFLVGLIVTLFGLHTLGGLCIPAGGIIGICVVLSGISSENRKEEEAEKRRRQEEQRARDAARDAQALALQHRISEIRRFSSDAQSAALSLPVILAEAETVMDLAETELAEGLRTPFWEAFEGAASQLIEFNKTLRRIAECRSLHRARASGLGNHAPPFAIGNMVFPDANPTYERWRQMYRRAHGKAGFSEIYETRRVSSKIDQTGLLPKS